MVSAPERITPKQLLTLWRSDFYNRHVRFTLHSKRKSVKKAKMKVPLKLYNDLRLAFNLHTPISPPISWAELSNRIKLAVPETARPKFNWLIARAVLQGIKDIKRTDEISVERYYRTIV